MFSLHEAPIGKTYTVFRVKSRQVQALEDLGIGSGCDLTLLSLEADGGAKVRLVNGREVCLDPEQAAAMKIDEQWVRKPSDPVFLSGCCSYGNAAMLRLWDEFINGETPAAR